MESALGVCGEVVSLSLSLSLSLSHTLFRRNGVCLEPELASPPSRRCSSRALTAVKHGKEGRSDSARLITHALGTQSQIVAKPVSPVQGCSKARCGQTPRVLQCLASKPDARSEGSGLIYVYNITALPSILSITPLCRTLPCTEGASLGEFKTSMGLSAKGALFDDLFCRPSTVDEALTTEPGRRTPEQVSRTHTYDSCGMAKTTGFYRLAPPCSTPSLAPLCLMPVPNPCRHRSDVSRIML